MTLAGVNDMTGIWFGRDKSTLQWLMCLEKARGELKEGMTGGVVVENKSSQSVSKTKTKELLDEEGSQVRRGGYAVCVCPSLE